MDGAKRVTDTLDIRKDCGRQAPCKGKSISERKCEPYLDEDPGESRNRVL